MPDEHATPTPKPARRRRLLQIATPAVVLLALAGSVAVNVLLYREGIEEYRRTAQAQLDPYGLKHPGFRSAPIDATKADQPLVVFFGDSRVRDWPAPAVPGFRFASRGIGGQTTEQIRGRFDAHVAPLAPKVVVVQAGINDLKSIPLFPERRAEIVKDCDHNLRDIITRAQAGGATVIVTTIFPTGRVPLARRPVWSDDIGKAVEEVNADLRTLASDRVIVLDAWKILEDGGRLRDAYAVDTLHLSPAGYAALNAEVEKVLRSLSR